MPNHPIFYPTFHGDLDSVRSKLEQDPGLVSVRDAKNLTPLHVAASRGQAEVADLLLDYGADLTGPTAKGEWTPLVFASYRGHLNVVRVLLDRGAGAGRKDGNPIHYAGQRKHKEICKLLVSRGAVDSLVRSKDPAKGDLFRAAHSYDAVSVERILSLHPKWANHKDRHGRTPLHAASLTGDTRTVEVLLKYGVDPSLQDHNHQTALDRAAAHRHHAVMKILQKG